MKRKPLYFLAAFLFIGLIINSCKKKDNSSMSVSHIDELYAGLKSTPQNFTVTAGINQTVYGADSTVLIFYPNSFKDKNGNIITSGTISLQLIEMYKPGDMITNNSSTTAGGQLLQSGGQVSISASMNGQIVYANKYGIAFKQKKDGGRMALYYGQSGQNNTTTWTMTDTSKKGTTSAMIKRQDSTVVDSGFVDTVHHTYHLPDLYYLFDSCTSFDWINCDHFYGDTTDNCALSVTLPNGFDDNNTQIYVVYPTAKATIHVDVSQTIKVPRGEKISVVVFAVKDGTYYYYQQTNIDYAPTVIVNATLSVDTRADIVARMAGL